MAYQKTSIGEIPDDWSIKQVQDIFEIKTGSTPSTKISEYWENGTVNWITPADMSKIEGIKIEESERKVTNIALKESNLNLVPKNSIILSTRAPVGYVGITSQEVAFNQGCKGLIPKDSNQTDSVFYSYYLLSKNAILQNLSGGSTFKELAKDTLKKFDLPVPPVTEQHKIARIIATTDQAIHKSNEIINKTRSLKKGIMRELLTKGIGHNGFKDTPIGKIPNSWKLTNLKDVIEVQGGYAFKSKEYTDLGVPLIRISNVSLGNVELKDLARVPSNYLEEYNNYALQEGDIVMALTRPIIGGGIKAGQIEEDHVPSLLNQRVGRLRILNNEILSPKFLFWTIFSDNFVDQMKKGLVTMNQPNISPKQIAKFIVPLPTKKEQDIIVDILSKVEDKLKLEQIRNDKLQKVKIGFMNHLLTGHKRVKIDG
ncbi:MAG: restriction endonuclease subunit S [Methanobacterium sp.]